MASKKSFSMEIRNFIFKRVHPESTKSIAKKQKISNLNE
jgi:hypothetical protein